jgi:hypothetical protein
MQVFKETRVIAGIAVHIHSAHSILSHSTPVAILFLLHGRQNSVESLESLAELLVKDACNPIHKSERAGGRDLVVITLVYAHFPAGHYIYNLLYRIIGIMAPDLLTVVLINPGLWNLKPTILDTR